MTRNSSGVANWTLAARVTRRTSPDRGNIVSNHGVGTHGPRVPHDDDQCKLQLAEPASKVCGSRRRYVSTGPADYAPIRSGTAVPPLPGCQARLVAASVKFD